MTTDSTVTQVRSPDGTRIAVFVSGTGRPLVVVPGTTSDHTTWRNVLPLLEPEMTVHAMDRRGRGASGDGADYSIAREYADVAAVVDAAAEAAGRGVDVLGHSYGGAIVFGAVALTGNIRKLVLYEGWPPPNPAHRAVSPDVLARLEHLIARGSAEAALETFYRTVAKLSEEDIETLRAAPTWPARVSAAHTVPRELRAFAGQAFAPETAAAIAVPVLLLVGSETPEDIAADPGLVTAALPDARLEVLKGQAHVAHVTAPEEFAKRVRSFLRA